jgi:hypothetical protein
LDHLNAAKIKFTLQQETDLDALILKENIIKALTESGYKVISSIDSTITFDNTGNNSWNLRGEKGFKMMEEGKFDILTSEKGTTVRLTYYFDAFFGVLLLPFILLGGIFRVSPAFFIGSVLLIQALIKIYMIKGVAKRMLWDIII